MEHTCIIIEDNEIERDALYMHLKNSELLNVVEVFSDALQAMKYLSLNAVDIVFSDIDMPHLNGTDLLKILTKPPIFIFTTSFSEYAAESYDLDALDFIVKPVTFNRLIKSANKAISYLELKKQINSGFLESTHQFDSEYFFFKDSKGISKMHYNELIYVESMGDFSKLYTANTTHVILISLKNLENQLPSSIFFRCHRQFILNINHIHIIKTNYIGLSNDFTVPISLKNRQDLLTSLVEPNTISRVQNKP